MKSTSFFVRQPALGLIMNDPIASQKLVQIKPDGARTPVLVSIGRPQPDNKGAWACPMFVEGLDSQERIIHGESSMQALCLAIGMSRFYLKEALRMGNRLVDSGEDSNFDIDVVFGVRIGRS